MKGRLVFQGNDVRDEYGNPAMIENMGSSPANMESGRVNVTYGGVPGHKSTTSDAWSAYTQSKLLGPPTWGRLPEQFRPKEWAELYDDPVVRLDLSLYGHPAAGKYWEEHSKEMLRRKGWIEVPTWNSCFWQPSTKLFLTVYVDDLIMSGPEEAHAKAWQELREVIKLDPETPLDRYLGCHHRFDRSNKDYTIVEYDMENFFRQTVEKYLQMTGLAYKDLKVVATPFLDEKQIPDSAWDTTGELGASSAQVLMKALYGARYARGDIMRPICILARNTSKWSLRDDMRLFRLMCYINCTLGHRQTAKIGKDIASWRLDLYADADLASEPDDSKSSSGAALFIVGDVTNSIINFCYKRQTCSATGTPAAELISMSHAVRQMGIPAVTLMEVLLGRTPALRVLEDNEAAAKIARKGFSAELRYLERTDKVHLGLLGDLVEQQQIYVEDISTDDMTADIFTKALKPFAWGHALELMMIKPG